MISSFRTTRLPRWAADILANPPRSGTGFHDWLFRTARALWKCGRNESEITAILENAAATCGRRVSAREIQDAVKNACTGAFQPASRWRPWPGLNCEQREAIIESGYGLVDLWETSPIRLDNSSHTEEIIDQLFPHNPLLCVGAATHNCHTATRDKWRGEACEPAVDCAKPDEGTDWAQPKR